MVGAIEDVTRLPCTHKTRHDKTRQDQHSTAQHSTARHGTGQHRTAHHRPAQHMPRPARHRQQQIQIIRSTTYKTKPSRKNDWYYYAMLPTDITRACLGTHPHAQQLHMIMDYS
jgi:hypothetical protein